MNSTIDSSKKALFIYGTGSAGIAVFKALTAAQQDQFQGFIQSSPPAADNLLGHPVYTPEQLQVEPVNDAGKIVIASSYYPQIFTVLMQLGIHAQTIDIDAMSYQ